MRRQEGKIPSSTVLTLNDPCKNTNPEELMVTDCTSAFA
jgi:hypothetical protein